MKKFLHKLLFCFSLLLLLIASSLSLKAQRSDTTLFDYDVYTFCNACNDNIIFNVAGTKDSFIDNTPSKEYLNSFKVKFKMFTCYTNTPLTLLLNGNAVGTINSNYLCSCNACDSLTFDVSAANIAAYYKYGQKNIIQLTSIVSGGLYIDRCIVFKSSVRRFDYDAGVTSVDTPSARSCAGTKNIVVKIKNYGAKAFTGVDVEWKWNGVSQTKATFSGSLDTLNGTGSNTAQVKLGSKSFSLGKADTLLAWTKSPGSVTDSLNINDTIRYIFYTGYKDTITVGGTSPTFSTIQAAVNSLVSIGVCGPTFVKIRPGTYNEQVSIGSIPGASASNPVTFLSSSNDSSKVLINFSSNNTNNFTLKLDNSSYVSFRKLTLEALNTSFGIVVSMTSNIDNIAFFNCHIRGITTTNTGSNLYAMHRNFLTSTSKTQNISLTQTRVSGGSVGFYLNNSSSNFLNGFYVTKCLFENNFYQNIYCQYAQNIGISNNIFERNSSSNANGNGIYFTNCKDSLTIVGNKIFQNNGSQGSIYLNSCRGTNSKRLLVANNFLSSKASTSNGYYTLAIYYCNYLDLVNNNIYQSTTNTSAYAMYFYEGNNNRLLYNNIINANKGTAFYVYSAGNASFTKSDRNNFYNFGNSLGTWHNATISSIANLNAIGFDTNSVSVNPSYTNANNNDLHVYQADLDGRAKPFAGVGIDIDGQVRSSSTPDIGADEFKLAALDAGISEVLKPLTGLQCVKVAFKNYGNTTLTSAKIDWSINGVSKSQISWTGSIAKGDTDIVCLGNITFKDTLYTVKAWSSAPNGGTDSIKLNDTLKVQFYPAMRGIYTIGGTTPDFSTFASAVAAIKRRDILDSVYFKVRNGTYTEQFEINNIAGALRKNAITFESESKDSSKVILQMTAAGSSANYVVWLNGATGVNLLRMTLRNTSASYRRVIQVTNFSKSLRFENNYFLNNDSISSSSLGYLMNFGSNGGREITIANNTFDKGSYGLYFFGNSSILDKNINILGNNFKNQAYTAVYLSYLSNYNFSGNTISSFRNTFYQGLYNSSSQGASTVSNNKINIRSNNAQFGMILSNFYSSTDTFQIFNNFVSIAGARAGYGIYSTYLQPANIQYNNVLNECTDSNSSSAALYMYAGDYLINNNNLVHTKNGYSFYNDYNYSLQSDFNNFLSNGTRFIYYSGTNYNNLPDFASSELLDTNSISTDPLFTSFSDLHTASVLLNTKAKPIAKITKDIDGQNRSSTTPDIGADEFTPLALDAGVTKLLNPGSILLASTINVKVVVHNLGLDTIKSLTVQAKVNKDTLTRKIFTRNIASGDTIHVSLGNYQFKADTIYSISAWSSLPNGNADQKKTNDTLKVFNKRTALTGVYTIGGTSPNFPTFKAAINALTTAGMLDSVRFRVRSGTYTEQLSITPILGSGNRNSVIFESENQDTTSVTLQYNSTFVDTNYVVQLNGADGITFRYLKIKALSTTNYCRIFDIKNRSEKISIYKNILEATNTSYGDIRNALIYFYNSANHGLFVKDNNIKNGDYALYGYGYNSSPPYDKMTGVEITGNRILNPFYYGIYLYDFDSIIVKNNYVFMNKYSYSYLLLFESIQKFNISNNTIIGPQAYIGLNVYNSGNGANTERNLISNNMMYLKNTSTDNYGFHFYYLYQTDVLHNSLKIENTSSSNSYAAYFYYGGNNSLYNNIFTNFNTGYSIYLNNASTFDSSDNNNFYSKGTILGYYNGTNANDLAAWQSLNGMDANSLSLDPLFKGTSNLHVKEVNLNGAARYFPRTAFDYDNESRDTLTPDIGADEFQLPYNDAGISKILTPSQPFLSDTQFVKVILKNYGGNPLYLVDIGWKFNGVSQTPFTWSDTLYSGDTAHVKIAKKFFNQDSAYSLKVWTSQPNGTGDSVSNNDTMQVKNQYPALSGIYTIGGGSPDFASFTDAVKAMKRGGIVDSVRFDVRNGTYYEQIIIPYIIGANKENSIIFQSEQVDSSKVILIGATSSTANYVVRLDSNTGTTFRYMSLRPSQTNYYNRVFEILAPSKKINIHHCNLKGKTTSNGVEEAIIYIYFKNSSLPGVDNINIYNNHFEKGAYGIYAYGYNNLAYGRNINIYKNTIEDPYYQAIQLAYINNAVINNNVIFNNSSQYTYSYGVLLQYCNEGFEITNNQIYNQEYIGLYLYQCNASIQDTALVANNFIHIKSNNQVYGVYVYYGYYLNFFNNNINISGSNSSSNAAYFYQTSLNFLYNNNFANTGGGYAMYLSGSFAKSNYNNFYTSGTNLAFRSSNLSNLSAWKSNTGYDANSLSVDPNYVSSTDLHVRATDLNGAGRNINYLIKFDIDGEKRDSLKPDIGADEFPIPSANDAGISAYVGPVSPFAAGNHNVKVRIKNFGSDTLRSATINWRVNGTTQASKSWTGKLKTGASDTITVGTFNFASGKKHDLKFWTINPNSVADTTNYNDTFLKKDIYAALKGVYTVEGTLPDYNTLTDAFKALQIGGNIDTVWFKMRSGTYYYDITISDYPGATKKRPVYIEAQSGDSSDVLLKNSNSSGQIIYIKGADHLQFRKLSFEPTYNYAIRLDNNAKGLTFSNCLFKLNSSYYYYGYGIYSGSDVDDSLTVQNNTFNGGYYGVYLYGINGSVYEKNVLITKNIFNNQYSSAVYLQYSDAPKITSNIINNSTTGAIGVNVYNTINNLDISYNRFALSSASAYGLRVYNCIGNSGKKGNIFNNFISINGGSNNRDAINFYNSDYINIFHNSVNVYGTNTTSAALRITYGNNYDVRNNVLSNLGGGYALDYGNSAGIAQSNYNDLYTTGTNLGVYSGVAYSNLAAWKSATSRDANSLSLDPSYNSNTDLHTNLSNLDSACNPISTVTDDIDRETRNTSKADIGADEFQSLPENLGISVVIAPVTSCGLDSSIVKLTIFNFGNKPQINFPIRFKIDAGSVTSVTITDSIKPGKAMDYQFAKRIPLSINKTYKITAWTDLNNEKYRQNDTLKLIFTNYSTPDTIKSMVPTDATTNLDFPVSLSWVPANGATRYDIYFWKFTDTKPSSPNISNTTQISYQINGGLEYGVKYNWQIISKNPVCSTPGLIKTFTMRFLPDLIVEQVTGPKSAFSSTNISVSWKIKNNASGTASGSWWDYIYLSADAVYDVTDIYLGGKQNPSGLNASQSYNQSHTVTLPNGISGNYYLFVFTDKFNNINEVDNNNNSNRDTGRMFVTLTPPPDLVVTSVTRPATAFSGSPANLTFTVKNKGTGATRSGNWYDQVFLSTEKVLNSSSTLLKTVYRSSNLSVDSTYTISTSVTIPNYISGKYFFVVGTDRGNQEYEHASEGNNTAGSDTIKVILTPPPDLIVEDVMANDTVSNSEDLRINYNVLNDGGTTTGGGFYDLLFICPTTTFSSTLSQYIGTVYRGALASHDTAKVSRDFKMPKGINGTYYLFVLTDYYNNINETTKENNNTSSAFKLIFRSPELIVQRVSVKSTDTTGSTTPISWAVKNQGKGTDFQGLRNDSIFISKSATWKRSNSTAIGRLRYNFTILPNDTLSRSTIVTIPDGFDGNRYFYVVTDASSEIYENGKDTNNYKRSNLMNVILSPYPDLNPSITSYPDSAEAGELIHIGYSVKNTGTKFAIPDWRDRFYFSKDSVFDLTKVYLLSTVVKSSTLQVDSSYQASVYMNLPASVARGNYYYFVYVDATKTVYEHFNDSNNIIRSKKIFIDGYPPVDLRVNCPKINDSMMSGNSYSLNYSVTNIGDAKTAIGAWNDGVFLSADSILTPSDLQVATIFINKELLMDSTYIINKSISIPNGLSGNFYLFVRADQNRLITDVDTNNNKKAVCKSTGGAKLLYIGLTPPPDLQITSWNVPNTATSGQPILIKWKVENKGSGSTQSNAWKDQFYLSTDYVIDNADVLISEKNHTGKLGINGTYTDSVTAYIPINKVGNFIVILKTDGANVEYEHNNEGNNTVSSITTASKAPPADLIVSSVTSPDSVLSGRSITISWKVKNQGSNPATGNMRDNIYLSTDSIQDGNDVLLSSQTYYLSLAPSAEVSKGNVVTVSGVSLGDYHVLVRTDVLNNINESNDTNNTTAALNHLNVNIPILPIAVKTPDTLSNNELIYHRIIVPSNLAGESLLITLKGDSVNGDNQIFVRYADVASGSTFDFKYREPFAGNQEIIIPELFEGTYYLLTTGKTKAGIKQNITLLARIMPFEIRKVTPGVGGNTGEVTMLIEGSKFDSTVIFYIADSAFTGLPGTPIDTGDLSYSQHSLLSPTRVVSLDPTQVYVTFNLLNYDTGFYDVVGLRGIEVTSLVDGFQVVPGDIGDLNVAVFRPGNTRSGNEIVLKVIFTNTGNIDLIGQRVIVSSTSGAPIAFTLSDLSKNATSLEVLVQENAGPAGRLRPGASGSIDIYAKATGALGFTIIK